MNKIYLLCLCLFLSACTHSLPTQSTPQDNFFSSMSSLCGQQFTGKMTFPKEGQDSFAGKTLIADFQECSPSQIRIPFSVGEDRSRTWIISKLANSLQLKHDHRHEDGSPDEVNLYGGETNGFGDNFKQSFHADAHTAKIIPEASSNVWTISLNQEKTELIYHLERHQKPRFTAVLKLQPQ